MNPPEVTVILLMSLSALAAGGCALELGPTEADGVVPMRATCTWPDVRPEQVARVLDDPTRQRSFGRVVDVQILDVHDGGEQTVWQRHRAGPAADREVVVRWQRHASADEVRWSWHKVPAALPRVPGNVECTRWDGTWTAAPLPGGGVVVHLDNHYDLGGYPSWLVRPFLGRELQGTVDDLLRAARSR